MARDHQPVHSYTAAGETVRDSCLNDVAGCDAYVLILSHRLGHVPLTDNPEELSITELAHREALRQKLQVVPLQVTNIRNVALTDVWHAARYARPCDPG